MAEEDDDDSRGVVVVFFAEDDSPGSYSFACGGERLGRPVGPTACVGSMEFLLGLEDARELSEGDALTMVSADSSEHPLCSFST